METVRTKHPHVARWLRFVRMPLLQLPPELSVILLRDVQLCEHHVGQMWHRAQSRAQWQVIGLDTEWTDGPDGATEAVLLQLCDDECVLLIRLHDCLPCPSLSALLSDGIHTIKSGVAIHGDITLLQSGYD